MSYDIVDIVIECFKAHRVDNDINGKYYIFPARMVSDSSIEKFVRRIEEERRKERAEMAIRAVNSIIASECPHVDDSGVEQ